MGSYAEALEDAEPAGHQAGHSQVSIHQLSSQFVDTAQPQAGLADDLSIQEF
jgi:hypothetical protein